MLILLLIAFLFAVFALLHIVAVRLVQWAREIRPRQKKRVWFVLRESFAKWNFGRRSLVRGPPACAMACGFMVQS